MDRKVKHHKFLAALKTTAGTGWGFRVVYLYHSVITVMITLWSILDVEAQERPWFVMGVE